MHDKGRSPSPGKGSGKTKGDGKGVQKWPCKYFNAGFCRLGKDCTFLHDPKAVKAGSKEDGKGKGKGKKGKGKGAPAEAVPAVACAGVSANSGWQLPCTR